MRENIDGFNVQVGILSCEAWMLILSESLLFHVDIRFYVQEY